METEGLDFKAALESLADRFGVTLETEDEDPGGGVAARAARAAVLAARPRGDLLRAVSVGVTRGGRRARVPARPGPDRGDAARVRRRLRAERLGPDPRAPRGRPASASRSCSTPGSCSARKTRPAQVYDRFRERIMFPSVDARGRVRGFGARAMRENQRPKYLNTSDGELYHKRSQLFGIDLARAAAARAGRMILVEGYTDVLALHQAGLRNAVGIMGTALDRGAGRRARADRPGARAVPRRRPRRPGRDAPRGPARRGPQARAARRTAARGDRPGRADRARRRSRRCASGSPARCRSSSSTSSGSSTGPTRAAPRGETGRWRSSRRCSPLPASALREDLLRQSRAGSSSRRGGSPRSWPGAAAGVGAGQPAPRPVPLTAEPPRRPTEARRPAAIHAANASSIRPSAMSGQFLVLCVARPEAGERALAAIDPDEHLTSARLRRVARHLIGRTARPMTDIDPEDEELARLIADLVARAGDETDVTDAHVEHAAAGARAQPARARAAPRPGRRRRRRQRARPRPRTGDRGDRRARRPAGKAGLSRD